MSQISDIRPTYPIVPVKRRDDESANRERKPKPKPAKPRPTNIEEDDSSPPIIDEYV